MSDYDDTPILTSSGESNFSPLTEEHDPHQPSAPTSDDNGYIVVNENAHHEKSASSHESNTHDDMSKLLAEISSSTEATLNKVMQKVLAEADSSTSAKEQPKKVEIHSSKKEDKSECSICPYYALGWF